MAQPHPIATDLRSLPFQASIAISALPGNEPALTDVLLLAHRFTADLAKGYTKLLGKTTEENYAWLPPRGEPAGGGYSTVEDLIRFATALTGHKLLDEKHTALLTTPKPGVPDQGYGYGFLLSREGSMRSFGRHGGGPGINSDLKIIPDAGYVIAVMGNLDPPAALRVANFAAARLPLKKWPTRTRR